MQDDLLSAMLGPLFSRGADPTYAWQLDAGNLPVLVGVNAAAVALADESLAPRFPDPEILAGPDLAQVREDVLHCLQHQVPLVRETEWVSPRTSTRHQLLLSHTPVTRDVAVTALRDLTALRQALAQQRERAEELAELTNLIRSLLEPQDPQDVRQAFCTAALRLAQADAVFLAEPRGDALVQVAKAAADGMPDHAPVRIPLEPGTRSMTMDSFLGATSVFIGDMDADPRVDSSLASLVGAGAGFFAPVVRQARVLGELLVAWRHPLPAPPERVVRLMPLLAADAAVAIGRADLIARLDEAAQSDALTGLPNRRASDAQLERLLAHALRTGAPLSVAVLDIDGLKAVNDREGHEAGDALLRHAAEAWRRALRREDQLSRVGGDEFVLLMPDTDGTEAGRAAERLRATAPHVSVSVGVTQWRRGESAAALLARADELMYADKQAHRS